MVKELDVLKKHLQTVLQKAGKGVKPEDHAKAQQKARHAYLKAVKAAKEALKKLMEGDSKMKRQVFEAYLDFMVSGFMKLESSNGEKTQERVDLEAKILQESLGTVISVL